MTEDGPSSAQLRRLLVWGLFFFGLALWAGSNLFGSARPESALVGQRAPAFETTVVAGEGAEDGDRISLDTLRGRVVLLDFWASWCAPCRASVPIVSRVVARHPELVALGVNVEHERDALFVDRAHRSLGFGFPSLHDDTGALLAGFDVRTIPTLFLIDAQGTVRMAETGIPDEGALEAQIRDLLEEID